MPRPVPGDYPPFYETYISLVPETDILQVLSHSLQQLKLDLSYIGSDKSDYAYAPGKWTVKQSESLHIGLCALPGASYNRYPVSMKTSMQMKQTFPAGM